MYRSDVKTSGRSLEGTEMYPKGLRSDKTVATVLEQDSIALNLHIKKLKTKKILE